MPCTLCCVRYRYNITAWFQGSDGTTTAPTTWRFGVREITSIIDGNGHRLYRVNGKNILIRGGGWASDLFFRTSEQRWRDEFQYMMHMGLNTVRVGAGQGLACTLFVPCGASNHASAWSCHGQA